MCTEKVSIVVPVYNAEDTINNCIDSLLGLDYPTDKLELIIVNNNSSDKTRQILQSYGDKILSVDERKRGSAAARNRGIKVASGDIIAFTDADCVVDKSWLRKLLVQFESGNPGIVAGSILPFKPINGIEKYLCGLHNHQLSIIRKMPYAITINWASRKKVLKEVGLFDENFMRSQDTELSFRISQKGYSLIYEPDAIVFHKDVDTYFKLFRKAYQGGYWNIKYYKKHQEAHKSLGLKKFRTKLLKQMVFDAYKILINNGNNSAKYEFVHRLGRQTGKLIGSLRFRYIDF